MKTLTRIAQIVAAAAVVTAAASVIVHPFGPVKRHGSVRPVFADANIDRSTELLFQRACQNCHSERTAWPWYSYVAPVSWLLERDVSSARAQLNLSRWDEYSLTGGKLSWLRLERRFGTGKCLRRDSHSSIRKRRSPRATRNRSTDGRMRSAEDSDLRCRGRLAVAQNK